jgi:phosphoglycerol transferase MdoB-like AlkP superfamily enzyme
MLHLECLEQRSLGLFNPEHPDLMPFLSSLAANTTVFEDMQMQPNMKYTVSSVFSLNSGVSLAGGRGTTDPGSTFVCSLVHTIQDYLDQAGYYQIASCTGFCSLWLFYKQHHMVIRHAEHTDQPHVKYLMDDLLPSLVQKKPFSLLVHLESTHPFFTIEDECEREIPGINNLPHRSMRAVQCVDYYVKKLYNKMLELGLDKDTVLVIYGDHQLWMEPDWYGKGTRPLLMVLPFEKKGIIKKTTTWYDFAPSMLKLLGFEDYEPAFPFGADLLGPDVGVLPTESDRIFIENTCLA